MRVIFVDVLRRYSDPAVSNLFLIQSVKKRHCGRGGRVVRERKRQRLQVAVYKPMCRVPASELIDLTL